MKTMVISDLDGTLLHSDARLSEFTVQAINSVIARGVNFTYATARSLNSSLTLTKRLALNLPVITYNGACIKQPSTGEIIEIQSLDEAQVALIAETLHRYGIHPHLGQVWFSLGSGTPYEYEAVFYDHRYEIRSNGQRAEIRADGKTLGSWKCGRRVVTDENGRLLRTEWIEETGETI